MSEAKWYVVHTYSGYENKVKANIEKTIENRHLEDQILEVRVPLEDVVEMRNGVSKQVQRKMFPKWFSAQKISVFITLIWKYSEYVKTGRLKPVTALILTIVIG